MPKRRDFVRVTIAVCALLMLVGRGPAGASATDDARAFIEDLSGSAIAVLGDETLADEARLEALSALFSRGFDTTSIGIFALGRHWRRATRAQLREYIGLFDKYIVATYSARLRKYGGENLAIRSARKTAGDVVVLTEIARARGPKVRVDWRVRQTEDGLKIIDVVVEGVSMALTQRDEFTAVLRKNGGKIEGLLMALRKRAGG